MYFFKEAVRTPWGFLSLIATEHLLLQTQWLEHQSSAFDSALEPQTLKLLGFQSEIKFSDSRKHPVSWIQSLKANLEAWFEGRKTETLHVGAYARKSDWLQLLDKELIKIPAGQTLSYGELAKRLGMPKAARAVGTGLRLNPIPLIVPCHRVVKADGKIGNYNSPQGSMLKSELISFEKSHRLEIPVIIEWKSSLK